MKSITDATRHEIYLAHIADQTDGFATEFCESCGVDKYLVTGRFINFCRTIRNHSLVAAAVQRYQQGIKS